MLETVLTAVLSAMVGGFIVHFLTLRRDRLRNRREIYTKYLIDAYNVIAVNAGRVDKTFDYRQFENAISVIQLFGNEKQIHLALEVATGLAEKKDSIDLTSLLEELRKSLRKELDLSESKNPLKILRFDNSEKN